MNQNRRPGLFSLRVFILMSLMMGSITVSLVAEESRLEPVKDTTIYQDEQGGLANGMGNFLFVGINGAGGGNRIMRALMAFDLTSIPSGSKVESVNLFMRNTLPRNDLVQRTVTVHRVLKDWGEGDSDADGGSGGGSGGADGAPAEEGDATWVHSSFDDMLWNEPGGDFEIPPSASANIGGNGTYQWFSNDDLVDDVQRWVDDPSTNFGWLLKGQEDLNGASFTARRFDSRHATAINSRPLLVVEYTPNPRPDFVFPQFVSGAGNSTRWILRNSGTTAAAGHLAFVDENGASTQVSVNGGLTDRVDFSLEPWGSFDVTTDSTGELTAGAAQVFVETGAAENLEAAEIFFLLGRYVSVTGAEPEKRWQVYVSRNETEDAGIAVQNPDKVEIAELQINLLDSNGSVMATETLTLQPGQRIAQFLGENLLFKDYFEQNPGVFEGTLNIHVTEGEDIAVVGLIQKKPGGDLIAVEATKKAFTGTPQ